MLGWLTMLHLLIAFPVATPQTLVSTGQFGPARDCGDRLV